MTHPLSFRADGSFTITQFTDLHYRNGEPEDLQTTRLMNDVLDGQTPDLVVLTGDVIDGSFCQDPIESYERAVRPIIDRKLTWAAVFGNHDDEGSATRAQLMAAMSQLPGCLATAGPAALSGVGNYMLPILRDDHVAAALYFLDSHAYVGDDHKQYDWIKHDQINWYLETSRQLRSGNHGAPVPALMFFHIPLPEYEEVWNTGQCVGEKHEAVCCPRIDSGLFTNLAFAGDVMGVFVGHDHVNDYTGDLQGIRLCYGRATGFSSYGRAGFSRGARVIRLRAGEREFETWVQLDDFSKSF